MTQAEISFGLGENATPFEEAVEWFLAKGIMTREEFNRLSDVEKTRAFTVAKIYAADEIQRVYDACERAISLGTTLYDFRQEVGDLAMSRWHAETVFRTNVMSAYGRGHWEQAQQTQSLMPYGRYSAVMDGRTRPSHARLHGLVYRLDHPFWQTYWPPWDYNCRCHVVLLSQWEVDRRGIKVSQIIEPDLPQVSNDFVSPARGGWAPRVSKYHPRLRQQVQDAIHQGQSAGGG